MLESLFQVLVALYHVGMSVDFRRRQGEVVSEDVEGGRGGGEEPQTLG